MEQVDVVVVGGGPGGIMFAYLAARAGLRVRVLEAAADFNREFRGDTLNPLALTLLEECGLIDQELAHWWHEFQYADEDARSALIARVPQKTDGSSTGHKRKRRRKPAKPKKAAESAGE